MNFLSVAEAARIVKGGGVVACPTETFYGLAVNPENRSALSRLFRIKKRERRKPILLIIASIGELDRWAVGIGGREKKLIRRFWPGPLTLVMKARSGVSPLLTAGTGKIGVRLSSEPLARRLARLSGGAITGTSANRSGEGPARKGSEVERQLGPVIDGIVSGKSLRSSKGSTILDVSGKKISLLRGGAIPISKIEKVLNRAS